jgi:hypothetical protein
MLDKVVQMLLSGRYTARVARAVVFSELGWMALAYLGFYEVSGGDWLRSRGVCRLLAPTTFK